MLDDSARHDPGHAVHEGRDIVPDRWVLAVVLEMRVINAASNLVTATPRRGADGQPELVIAEVAAQISERRGPVGAAMRNVYGRGSL